MMWTLQDWARDCWKYGTSTDPLPHPEITQEFKVWYMPPVACW
jgi:hypothetical protein